MSGTNLSPEDYNWVKAAMDGPHLQRTTAITIALASSLDHPRPIPPTWDVEPPPQIDYWLVHSMIRLAERALTDQDRERYDRLSAARKAYYTAHGRFQHAYHGLADAQAFECILYAERSDICAYGEKAEGQWAESERQKALNAWELVRCWQEVRVAMEVRRIMTLQLSREKRAFLERDVRRLAFLCRHAHGQWNLHAEAVIERPQTDPNSSSAATPESATEDGGSTQPIVCPRNHPKQFNFRIPATANAPRVDSLNQQHEHATPGPTSTDEGSTSAQETSDSDRCPGCVREEMAERARTTGAGGTSSNPAVTSNSKARKRTHSDMIGKLPDSDDA